MSDKKRKEQKKKEKEKFHRIYVSERINLLDLLNKAWVNQKQLPHQKGPLP